MLYCLGPGHSSAELNTAFPNFYVSSWSSPSTPIPHNRIHQSNSDDFKSGNDDLSCPVSFSQRLRDSQRSNIGSHHSSRAKSLSSSLTAFERAKLMMRLRGGNDSNDTLGRPIRKIDKDITSTFSESSGK